MAFLIQEPLGKLTGPVRAQETRSDERQLQPLKCREFFCEASVSDSVVTEGGAAARSLEFRRHLAALGMLAVW